LIKALARSCEEAQWRHFNLD